MSLYSGMTRTGAVSERACDLRSDTVTRPDEEMRTIIATAKVGDDVYGEDPTALRLEAAMAECLGKEAAVFFPTGTQSNLAALMAHCGRGDEAIVGNRYHIYCDEAAGAAVLAGISLCPVTIEAGGQITPNTVASAIKDDDPHYAHSRLLCLENTVGGRVITLDKMRATSKVAKDHGLAIHLDGARFFNAITALECTPVALAGVADTVSVCLSKGLGAPVGSILAGTAKIIAKARRNRKILGGAMRQVGVLAAAGLHALENNVDRLTEDHRRAAVLAEALRALNVGTVCADTNMIFFTPAPRHHVSLRNHMAKAGVLIGGQSPSIRMVLHKDIDDVRLDQAITAFQAYYHDHQL